MNASKELKAPGPSNVKYPTRQPDLSCILTRHQPALFTPKNVDEDLSLMQFFTLMSSMEVVVRDISDAGMDLEFDLLGVEPCIANSLRRSLLSDVPSMAPETVLMNQNTTIFSDDNIGSRLGLIPFRVDPRRFKFRVPKNTAEHADFAAIFELNIPSTKVAAPSRSATKNAAKPPNVNVYSGDLKWLRHPSFPKDMRQKDIPRPVSGKILLATMLPSQELMLRVHVVKGIGKDHAKFSPVSTATYRPIPDVRLLRPIHNEQADLLQSYLPKGVIDIKQEPGMDSEAFVANSRLYATNRRVFTDPDLASSIQIGFRENEFIFNVESVGALTSAVLVEEAIRILKDRCEFLNLICPQGSTWPKIKVEENP